MTMAAARRPPRAPRASAWLPLLLLGAGLAPLARADAELPPFVAPDARHAMSAAARAQLARAYAAARRCPCPGECARCESVHAAIARASQADGNQSCFLHVRGWWRTHLLAVAAAVSAHGLHTPALVAGGAHAYEFGVFSGRTMRFVDRQLRPAAWWGFDSFRGLPPSDEPWQAGALVDDQRASLRASLGGSRVGFVAGWYNESLPPPAHVLARMRPALWVDVDCDLYMSSVQALDFMFAHGLIVPGSLVGYDDWWQEPCRGVGSPLGSGEGRAHVEMARKWRVRFECVAGPCAPPSAGAWPAPRAFPPGAAHGAMSRAQAQCSVHSSWGPIFLVRELGPAVTPEHGFRWDAALRTKEAWAPICALKSANQMRAAAAERAARARQAARPRPRALAGRE